ncbi:MAG: hypothetical protein ACJAYX_004517 [Planctomycetota bacterium]
MLLVWAAIRGLRQWFSGPKIRGARRTQPLKKIASELGLDFDAAPDHNHQHKFPQFGCFNRGETSFARNTLRGTIQLFGADREIVAGDYRAYDETTNDNFSYLILRMSRRTPSLLIRPTGLLSKLKRAVGRSGIQFESAAFNRKFSVKSSEESFAREVLHPGMVDFLLREKPRVIDIADRALLITDGRRQWGASQLKAQVRFLSEFCERLPPELYRKLGV